MGTIVNTERVGLVCHGTGDKCAQCEQGKRRGKGLQWPGRTSVGPGCLPDRAAVRNRGSSPLSGDYTSSIGLLQDGRGVALDSLVLRAAGQAQLLGPCSAWSLLLLLGPEEHL